MENGEIQFFYFLTMEQSTSGGAFYQVPLTLVMMEGNLGVIFIWCN